MDLTELAFSLFLLALIPLFFTPTIIAFIKKTKKKWLVLLLNILVGAIKSIIPGEPDNDVISFACWALLLVWSIGLSFYLPNRH
ncbi:MAG: hypothetical protein ACM3MK_08615 [Chitinophagales bacterium]